MKNTVSCPNCRQRIVIDEAQAGQTLRCPRCKAPVVAKRQPLYYLQESGKDSGPFTLNQLRSMWQAGKINAATHYSSDGMNSWHQLIDMVSELEGETKPRSPAVSAPGAKTPATTQMWDPGLAAVLSFFIPGLGQLYKGMFGNALVFFILISILYTLGVTVHGLWFLVGLIGHGFCIFEAYTVRLP